MRNKRARRWVDTRSPINQDNPLNQGGTLWALVMPRRSSVPTWRDLYGRRHLTANGGPLQIGSCGFPTGFPSISLDGVDDFFTTGLALSQFITASAGTLSIWARLVGAAPAVGAAYDGDALIADVDAYAGLHRAEVGGSDRVWAYNWDGTEDRAGITYTAGVWKMFTWVHRGGTLYAYGNGVLEAQVASGSTQVLTANMRIGGGIGVAGRYLEGQINDVCAWPFGLTDDQVLKLYRQSVRHYARLLNYSRPRLHPVSPAAGGAFTLTANSGTFTITGTAATLKAGRKLTANSGAYTVTGAAATLKAGRKLTANSGTYAVAGTVATLKVGRKLTASSGAFTVTGATVTLKASRKLTATPGAYTVTGTAATLTKSAAITLTATPGAFVIAGTAVSLKKGFRLTATSGAFVISGTAASLEKGYRLSANAGAFVIAGTAAGLRKASRLTATSGAVAITGTAATLTKVTAGAFVLNATPGAFTITGTAATLKAGRKLTATAGTVTISGTAASLKKGRLLVATAGVFALAGTPASLKRGRLVLATPGAYAITGTAATLTFSGAPPTGGGGMIFQSPVITGAESAGTFHSPVITAA